MKNKMNQRKGTDDLDYLSSLGYEKIPFHNKDLQDIHHRIDKRIFRMGSKINFYGVGILFIILTASSYAYFKVGKQNTSYAVKEVKASEKVVAFHTNGINFPIPSVNDAIKPKSFKQTKPLPLQPNSYRIQPEVVYSIPVLKIIPSDLAISCGLHSINLPYSHAITFLHDLKITDYHALYEEEENTYYSFNKGIPAFIENGTVHTEEKDFDLNPMRVKKQELIDKGLIYFSKKEYQNALPFFIALKEKNPKDVNALFYSSLCFFNIGNYTEALKGLEAVRESENNAFKEEAIWYMALAYLTINQSEAGIGLLLRINESNGFYAEQAAKKLVALQD